MNKNIANGLILFGGTGDLTKRKLLPAIYNLYIDNLLPDDFFVLSVGRREKDTEQYRKEMRESIESFSRNKLDNQKFESVANRVYYYKMDFTQSDGYTDLDKYINSLDSKHKTEGNRMFYLAISPDAFGTVVNNLHKYKLASNATGSKRVVIEKPFGRDLKSAELLNKQISKTFDEKDIYRIDHYLGKEMLQNIMVIRFANAAFEPIWNSEHIDHVQITSSETLGVEERGGYYEKSGALRDMVQNHLLQFLSLIAMDEPKSLNTEDIRDEKVKVLKRLEIYNDNEVKQNVVRGQYNSDESEKVPSYRQENRVDDDSDTETYVALKLNIKNKRWKGVPFYIRTGKRMKKKGVQAIVQFKNKYKDLYGDVGANQIAIQIQPKEGVNFKFNAKQPGDGIDIIPVNMDFCQNCIVGYNSQEAYERLLLDVMKGDKTLFTRWDEVMYSWKFVDSINSAWQQTKPNFPNYNAYTFGPKEADQLMTRDGREWVNDLY